MGTVSDKLETVISLKDDYSQNAAKVLASTLKLGSAFSSVAGAGPYGLAAALVAVGAAATAASAFMQVFKTSLLEVGDLMGGLKAMKLSEPFLEAAKGIDTMERQLGAMLGSMTKGKEAMKWIQSYGLTSGLEQGPLMEMTRTLLLANKSPGRYLPIMETLSMMGGGEMSSNAMDVSSVFRRLMGGQIADALGPEGLGRFGINKQMLGQYGAGFDNQGRFKGTIQDALDVLERMVSLDPRLKDLKKSMDSSIAVKLSNLTDAFNLAKSEIGKSISDWLLPKIVSLSNTIAKLAKSGVIKEMTDKLLKIFGLGGNDGMSRGLITLVAVGSLFIDILDDMKKSLVNFTNTILKIAEVLTMGAFRGKTVELFEGFKVLLDARIEMLKKAMAGVSLGANEPIPQGATDLAQTTQSNYLAQIADNTRKTADYQRMILGGGSQGAYGVTPVELRGIRSGGKYERAVQLIREAVSDEAAMMQRARQRAALVMG